MRARKPLRAVIEIENDRVVLRMLTRITLPSRQGRQSARRRLHAEDAEGPSHAERNATHTHAGGTRCARHRSRGSTETQTEKHAEAACVSVLPLDRCAGRTAAGTHRRRNGGQPLRISATQRSLRETSQRTPPTLRSISDAS